MTVRPVRVQIRFGRPHLAAGVGVLLALLAAAVLWWQPWATGCRPGAGADLLSGHDPAVSVTPIRVMPLGDSLTDGFNVPGGYRIALWSRLASDGLCVDFVGSQSNGPASLPDKDHEGHPGWRIDEISRFVVPWLEQSRPHVILLLIGTNDVGQDFALDAAPERLSALIDRILASRPASRLIVASIPPLANSVLLQRAQAYNAALAAVVASKGPRVWYVDAFSAFDASDLDADGIHLNPDGYGKLAGVWYTAIRALVTP